MRPRTPVAPLTPVEFGEVQQQIAPVRAERVQRAYLREPFGDRATRPGQLPEVQQ